MSKKPQKHCEKLKLQARLKSQKWSFQHSLQIAKQILKISFEEDKHNTFYFNMLFQLTVLSNIKVILIMSHDNAGVFLSVF